MTTLFYKTQLTTARPMNRIDYYRYRGWDLPDDQKGSDTGYLLESMYNAYPDYKKYVSWITTDEFNATCQPTYQMNFSHALMAIKSGQRVARSGWNGTDMFVFLVPGSRFTVNREPLLSVLGEGTEVDYRPHIDIKQADDSIGVWQPSMGDVMANDWYIVP